MIWEKCLAKNSLGVIQGLQFAESENYPVFLCRVKTRIFFNHAETRRTFWARALSTSWTEYECFVFQIKCPTFVILMVYRFTVFPVDMCLWPFHFFYSFINEHPVEARFACAHVHSDTPWACWSHITNWSLAACQISAQSVPPFPRYKSGVRGVHVRTCNIYTPIDVRKPHN